MCLISQRALSPILKRTNCSSKWPVLEIFNSYRAAARVAYSTYLNTRLLEIIRRLAVRSTHVVRESLSTRQAIWGVLRGNLHAGFGILPILETDIAARLLFEERLMACLPVAHRLAAKSTIQPEDLENEPLVSLARKEVPGKHGEIIRHFAEHGYRNKELSR